MRMTEAFTLDVVFDSSCFFATLLRIAPPACWLLGYTASARCTTVT